MTPRKKMPFKHIPYRQHGYGTKAAADLLNERGLKTNARMLRYAANKGDIAWQPSPGGHRRFMAKELEHYLSVKIDKGTTPQ